jgi:DNA-binding IclR family transcriptional regulator
MRTYDDEARESTMPWGKFAGRRLDGVPLSYLAWAIEEATLTSELRRAIETAIARRVGVPPEEPTREVRCVPCPQVAELARQLVAVGYRTLAKKLHPDTGGTHGEMILATAARDYLQHVLEYGAEG